MNFKSIFLKLNIIDGPLLCGSVVYLKMFIPSTQSSSNFTDKSGVFSYLKLYLLLHIYEYLYHVIQKDAD